MEKSISKIVLTAILWIALAFTFSCSSDDDKGGDDDPKQQCYDRYEAMVSGCSSPTCIVAAEDVRDKCLDKYK